MKTLANKPIKITNEIIQLAIHAFDNTESPLNATGDVIAWLSMKAALEAVFNHIEDKLDMVTPEENQLYLEKELIREMIKPKDGWIRYRGNPDIRIEVKYEDDKTLTLVGRHSGHKKVIAYRIISEQEEEGRWNDPENFYNITGMHLKPKDDGWIKNTSGMPTNVWPHTLIKLQYETGLQELLRMEQIPKSVWYSINTPGGRVLPPPIREYKIIGEFKEERKSSPVPSIDFIKIHENALQKEEKMWADAYKLTANFIKDAKETKKQTLYDYAWKQYSKSIDVLTPPEIIELISEYLKQEGM